MLQWLFFRKGRVGDKENENEGEHAGEMYLGVGRNSGKKRWAMIHDGTVFLPWEIKILEALLMLARDFSDFATSFFSNEWKKKKRKKIKTKADEYKKLRFKM